jgi:hypothetical protein
MPVSSKKCNGITCQLALVSQMYKTHLPPPLLLPLLLLLLLLGSLLPVIQPSYYPKVVAIADSNSCRFAKMLLPRGFVMFPLPFIASSVSHCELPSATAQVIAAAHTTACRVTRQKLQALCIQSRYHY